MAENGDWNRGGPPPGPGGPPGGGYGPPDHKKYNSTSAILIFLNVFNTITHIFIGGVTFAVFIFVRQGGTFSTSFTQHVILCTFGYFVLMSQAILSIDPRNGWSNGLGIRDRKISHWLIQIAASGLAIAGSVIRIESVGGNFATNHSLFGLIALILTCVSLLGGVLNLFNAELRIPGRLIKVCHALVGCAAYVCAIVSLCYGMDKVTFRNYFDDFVTATLIGTTAVAAFGTLLSTFGGVYRRILG